MKRLVFFVVGAIVVSQAAQAQNDEMHFLCSTSDSSIFTDFGQFPRRVEDTEKEMFRTFDNLTSSLQSPLNCKRTSSKSGTLITNIGEDCTYSIADYEIHVRGEIIGTVKTNDGVDVTEFDQRKTPQFKTNLFHGPVLAACHRKVDGKFTDEILIKWSLFPDKFDSAGYMVLDIAPGNH